MMDYVDLLNEYAERYGVDYEEAERLLDSDLSVSDCRPEDFSFDVF